MQYSPFLLNNIPYSKLGFGGATLSGEGGGYGFGPMDENLSQQLIERAIELGVTVFDSAPIYGYGLAEQRLGKYLRKSREQVLVITKGGVSWHSNRRVNMSNEPKIIKQMLEQSLIDLDLGYIDLYMIHWPDKNIDIRYPMDVLVKAQDKGQIKAIGLANTNKDDLTKASSLAKIELLQSECNIWTPVDEDLLEFIKTNKIPFMAWGTLDKGILTGNVYPKRVFDPSDARSFAPWWKNADKTWKYSAVDELKKYAKDNNFSLLNLAVSYNLNLPWLSTSLIGWRTIEQLDDSIRVLEDPISNEFIENCQEIVAKYAPSTR